MRNRPGFIAVALLVSLSVLLIRCGGGDGKGVGPGDYPAFYFIIFHVAVANPVTVGDAVAAAHLLGNHIGDQTMSDIAVGVSTPGGWKLVSHFDVLTDSLFQSYQAAGVSSRDTLIISREARDADPLTCSGKTITGTGTLENWVVIN